MLKALILVYFYLITVHCENVTKCLKPPNTMKKVEKVIKDCQAEVRNNYVSTHHHEHWDEPSVHYIYPDVNHYPQETDHTHQDHPDPEPHHHTPTHQHHESHKYPSEDEMQYHQHLQPSHYENRKPHDHTIYSQHEQHQPHDNNNDHIVYYEKSNNDHNHYTQNDPSFMSSMKKYYIYDHLIPQKMSQMSRKKRDLDFHQTTVTNEEKHIAGCLINCIYKKHDALDKLGWPTLDGLVNFYTEGVNEHGFFMATLRAADRCLKISSAKYHANRYIKPNSEQSCELAFDVFDCVTDRITEYCSTTTEYHHTH